MGAKSIKVLLYILIIIILIIIGLTTYLYSSFNDFSFKDEFAIDKENLEYYSESYTEARVHFLDQVEVLQSTYPNSQTGKIKVPSLVDTSLYIDYFYLPALHDSSNLMVLISGTHGVEAYMGSAFQQLVMQEYINDDFLQNSGIFLIHSFNPYGFKYSRRVTENNVDMNRNCSNTPDLYKTINSGYPIVNHLINPIEKVDVNSMSNKFFFATAINEIRKSSMPVLRQAVLQGQYQFDKGVYFGGYQAELQVDSLAPIIRKIAQPYENVFALDIHTGYGHRGKLHLFPNPIAPEMQLKMEALFEGYVIDWGDKEEFYTVTGDVVGFIGDIIPEKEFLPMVFEFGTMNSNTTMGSIQSLYISIIENQGAHYGYNSDEDKSFVDKWYKEMFYPSSPAWRSHCISESRELLDNVLPRYLDE